MMAVEKLAIFMTKKTIVAILFFAKTVTSHQIKYKLGRTQFHLYVHYYTQAGHHFLRVILLLHIVCTCIVIFRLFITYVGSVTQCFWLVSLVWLFFCTWTSESSCRLTSKLNVHRVDTTRTYKSFIG